MNEVEFVAADIFGTAVVAKIEPEALARKLAEFVSKVLAGIGDTSPPYPSQMDRSTVRPAATAERS